MSGNSLRPPSYRLQALLSAPLAVICLTLAWFSWTRIDWLVSIIFASLALVLGLSAIRSAEASKLARRLDDFIDHRESVLARLGGMLDRGDERRPCSALIVLSEQHLYIFELHVTPEPPILRLAYANLLSVHMDAPKRPSTLVIELPSRTISLHGLQLSELIEFERILKEKRPNLITEPLAEELRNSQST